MKRKDVIENWDLLHEAFQKIYPDIQTQTVEWTPPKLARLKLAIQEAESLGKDESSFEGQEFYVPYAKYLCEYLESKFGENA